MPSPRQRIIAAWRAELGDRVAVEPDLRRLLRLLQAAAPRPVSSGSNQSARRSRPLSLARVAELAHRAGARVQFGEFGGGEEDRMLSLASPAALEAGLRQLHAALSAAQSVGDAAAVERARLAARRFRRRALLMAAHPRLHRQIRAEKQEMADWLLLWLEMPDAFFDWLEIRRSRNQLSAGL